MRQSVAVWLALCAGVTLVAGCGKSSPMPSDTTNVRVRKAQLVTYAHAVNLRKSDAPGMVALSAEGQMNVVAVENAFARCLGLHPYGRDVIRVYSPRFSIGSNYEATSVVGGDVNPRQSAATVAAGSARGVAAMKSNRGIACIEHSIQREYKEPGVHRVVTSLPNPLSGLDGSVGLRFEVAAAGTVRGLFETSARVKSVYYRDLFYLDVATANIVLEATGYSGPVALATERRLLSHLYNRAEAHKL